MLTKIYLQAVLYPANARKMHRARFFTAIFGNPFQKWVKNFYRTAVGHLRFWIALMCALCSQ